MAETFISGTSTWQTMVGGCLSVSPPKEQDAIFKIIDVPPKCGASKGGPSKQPRLAPIPIKKRNREKKTGVLSLYLACPPVGGELTCSACAAC